MSISLQELATHLGGRPVGGGDALIEDVASLETARPHHLSFVESRKHLPAARKCEAGALLIGPQLEAAAQELPCPAILVDDPQAAFVAAMLLFRPARPRSTVGISPQAIVAPSARLGAGCNVFPGAQIGEDVVIGANCDIGPGVVIGAGCRLGDNCVLHPRVVLYPDIHVRNRVIIHAGAVIGADGFGYHFREGALRKIPHTGTVILEDDVEIGACATVDRAMLGATVIGQGTKLDNQVMIAHNCRVGRHNAFASQVGLAGSVTTGDYVQMGGQVGIADHVSIAGGIKLGGKAGVMGDLTEPGVYHDIPARPEKEAIKSYLNVQKVPELRDQVKQLQAQITELQSQLASLATPSPARERSAA